MKKNAKANRHLIEPLDIAEASRIGCCRRFSPIPSERPGSLKSESKHSRVVSAINVPPPFSTRYLLIYAFVSPVSHWKRHPHCASAQVSERSDLS